MPRRNETHEAKQLGLFEETPPEVELSQTKRQELATLMEALLLEIATELATGEAGDDQDHR